MIIDKHCGQWSDETTQLDDYAYELYKNYIIKTYTNTSTFGPQKSFANAYMKYNNTFVNDFYDKAVMILRQEKIKKILWKK
jgi:hypothetical protein